MKREPNILDYFTKFPREVGSNRRLIFNYIQLSEFISQCKFSVHAYTSLYNFSRINVRPDYETANVDKVFFDIDGNKHEQMMQLHNTLLKRDLMHFILFSGGGFHIFVITDNQEFQNKKDTIKNFQIKICDEANLTHGFGNGYDVDESVFDGTTRICRLPYTFNPKRGRFCFPLNSEILEDFDKILEMSKNPFHVTGEIWGKCPSNLQIHEISVRPDNLYIPRFSVEFGQISIPADEEGFCSHVKKWLVERSCREAWFFATLIMKINGYTRDEADAILRKYLSKFPRSDVGRNDYEHAIIHDKILDSVYGSDKYMFPNLQTLVERGLLNEGCNLCVGLYLHRRER